MKAVLMSIRPQWCELIAAGKKTVEVRKTKPKLATPFKAYIYCTHPKAWFRYSSCGRASDESLWLANGKVEMCDGFKYWNDGGDYKNLNGKVIGEFVCDKVFLWNHDIHNEDTITLDEACEQSCLSENSLLKYADGYFYGWHISNLVIYDKPKLLTDFTVRECIWHNIRNNGCIDASGERCYDCRLKRPPQSWCYVEEM